MEHYVTLFDGNFLPQGLALAESLERHAGEHVLWVLCLDERARAEIQALGKASVRTIALAEAETPELLGVKPGRTLAEYCWTLTPFAPRFVFEREPAARRVTYLDADLFMLKSPAPIFAELESSGKSVLITEHNYDPACDFSAEYGRFCVQFVTFARDGGERVRDWWEKRCIEWCFARAEDGKFGDQKYLDDWPERFAGEVHVLQRKDAIQAPWNARRFSHAVAIAWHFHGLRIRGRRIRWYRGYRVPFSVDVRIYAPYVTLLRALMQRLRQPVEQEEPARRGLVDWWHTLLGAAFGFRGRLRRARA